MTNDKNKMADEVLDLIVVHPPFLQLLHAKDFTQLEIRDFLRSRRARFALGLRHLELCIENDRLLDPRIETAEVFPSARVSSAPAPATCSSRTTSRAATGWTRGASTSASSLSE